NTSTVHGKTPRIFLFSSRRRHTKWPRDWSSDVCSSDLIPGRWHVMGVTQAAGLSLRWFRDTFTASSTGAPESYDHLTAEAAKVPPGSDGLLWTPYLMGERTPHLDGSARGALVGITASHTRGHIVRAILEGVAFSLRDTFTLFQEMNVPVQCIRLGGGGARSPLWRQIQADVYGHAVEIVE